MKSFLSLCLILMSLQCAFSQEVGIYSEQALKRKVIDNVTQYLLKYFDKADFDKHISPLEEDVFIYYTIPRKNIKKDSIAVNTIQRIEIFTKFTTENYKGSIHLELEADLTVREKMRLGEPVNLTALFVQAHSQYLQNLKEGKILSPDSVLAFVKQQHPNEEWSEPEIKRESFPPYSFHYQVFQNNCSPCKAVNVSLTSLNELNTETHKMIPIYK